MSEPIDYVYIRTDPKPEGAEIAELRQHRASDLALTRAHLKAARQDGFHPHRRDAVTERISAAVAASGRPKFVKLLRGLEPYTTLIVRTLDGLGRDADDILKTIRQVSACGAYVHCLTLSHLALTEVDDIMITLEGLAKVSRSVAAERDLAKGTGRGVAGGVIGRPHSLDDAARAKVRAGLDAGETVSALARRHNTSRQTILRVRDGGERAGVKL